MGRGLHRDDLEPDQVVQLRTVAQLVKRSLPLADRSQERLGLLQTVRIFENALRRLRPRITETLELVVDFVQALDVGLERVENPLPILRLRAFQEGVQPQRAEALTIRRFDRLSDRPDPWILVLLHDERDTRCQVAQKGPELVGIRAERGSLVLLRHQRPDLL